MGRKLKAPNIEYATYIKAPPKKVYEALTTAQGWDAWFTRGMRIDPRPGGQIEFRWKDFGAGRVTAREMGLVLAVVPNRKFVFQWSPGGLWTTVAFSLRKRGRGTLVKVVESGYPATRKGLAWLVLCAGGWGEALTLLKFYLEHGVTYGKVPPARPSRD